MGVYPENFSYLEIDNKGFIIVPSVRGTKVSNKLVLGLGLGTLPLYLDEEGTIGLFLKDSDGFLTVHSYNFNNKSIDTDLPECLKAISGANKVGILGHEYKITNNSKLCGLDVDSLDQSDLLSRLVMVLEDADLNVYLGLPTLLPDAIHSDHEDVKGSEDSLDTVDTECSNINEVEDSPSYVHVYGNVLGEGKVIGFILLTALIVLFFLVLMWRLSGYKIN